MADNAPVYIYVLTVLHTTSGTTVGVYSDWKLAEQAAMELSECEVSWDRSSFDEIGVIAEQGHTWSADCVVGPFSDVKGWNLQRRLLNVPFEYVTRKRNAR